jgi:hypothetical protein
MPLPSLPPIDPLVELITPPTSSTTPTPTSSTKIRTLLKHLLELESIRAQIYNYWWKIFKEYVNHIREKNKQQTDLHQHQHDHDHHHGNGNGDAHNHAHAHPQSAHSSPIVVSNSSSSQQQQHITDALNLYMLTSKEVNDAMLEINRRIRLILDYIQLNHQSNGNSNDNATTLLHTLQQFKQNISQYLEYNIRLQQKMNDIIMQNTEENAVNQQQLQQIRERIAEIVEEMNNCLEEIRYIVYDK